MTTTEPKSRSAWPRLLRAKKALCGQGFITAAVVSTGPRITGRTAQLGRTVILAERRRHPRAEPVLGWPTRRRHVGARLFARATET